MLAYAPAGASRDAATKQADARREAVEDTTTAEFNVAAEKCGALAGQAKDDCVSNANMRFGQ